MVVGGRKNCISNKNGNRNNSSNLKFEFVTNSNLLLFLVTYFEERLGPRSCTQNIIYESEFSSCKGNFLKFELFKACLACEQPFLISPLFSLIYFLFRPEKKKGVGKKKARKSRLSALTHELEKVLSAIEPEEEDVEEEEEETTPDEKPHW